MSEVESPSFRSAQNMDLARPNVPGTHTGPNRRAKLPTEELFMQLANVAAPVRIPYTLALRMGCVSSVS